MAFEFLSHSCHRFNLEVGDILRDREVGQARIDSGREGLRGGDVAGESLDDILAPFGSLEIV